MQIGHHITYIYRLNRDFWRYTKRLSFMWRVYVLEFLDALKKIFPKMENFMFTVNAKLKKTYLFTTPFGTYLCHTQNAWWVMQENYEPELKEVIYKNIEKNKTNPENYFLNIGCHIGRWAIDVARHEHYRGLLFEPSPDTFKMLKINTVLSEVDDKVTLHNFGLGDTDGVLDFEYFVGHDGGSRVKQTPDAFSQFAQNIQVPIKKFDTLGIDTTLLEKVRLVIMDVEGFELNVLRGMQESLKKFHDIDMIVEIFKDHPQKQETIDFMKKLGFKAQEIEKDNYLFSK